MTDDTGVIPLRLAEDDAPQAAEWLAKLDRGDMTSEQRAEFARWLAADPQNKHAIRDVAAMWYGLNEPLSRIALAAGGARHVESPLSLLLASFAGLFRRFAGVAAILTVVGVATAYFVLQAPVVGSGYYSTKIGETRVLSLADGSRIHLNTNSILEQTYSKSTRELRLVAGEAIFDVAPDRSRPFIVYAANGLIRAIGTKFAVRVAPDKVIVTVTEGRVALAKREPTQSGADGKQVVEAATSLPLLIGRGEAASVDRAEGRSMQELSEREISERLSWEKGELVFYDKELQSVIDEVARYTTVRITVMDDALKIRKITGILPIGNVAQMLDGIESSLGVKAQWVSPNVVHVTAKNSLAKDNS